jgi:uncharacterized protein
MQQSQKSLLWEISTPEKAKEVSHIFGSMHVRDQRAHKWVEVLEDYIVRSSHFFTEVDLSNREDAPFSLWMPEGESLDNYTSPARWQQAKRFVKKVYNVDLDHFKNIYPIIVVNELTQQLLSEDAPIVLDLALSKIAEGEGIPQSGIETWSEQYALMNKITIPEQANFLFKMIFKHKRFRKQLMKLVKLYEDQDIQGLYKNSKAGLGRLRKVMLYDRNKIMTQRIYEQIVERDPSFFAVGAAHLGGARGVLVGLKRLGLHVKPVYN